ncbi:MAG: TfoX/Sxy family protein [Nakamurella sp.]
MREVRMFGGVSFMVDGRMAVATGREGDLLVRIDPDRYASLREVPGAQEAVMGPDRPMGPGWIRVARPHLETHDELSFWIRAALEFHASQTKGAEVADPPRPSDNAG